MWVEGQGLRVESLGFGGGDVDHGERARREPIRVADPPTPATARHDLQSLTRLSATEMGFLIWRLYKGTALIKNTQPPKITIGAWAWGCCRILRGVGGVLMSEVPLYSEVTSAQ